MAIGQGFEIKIPDDAVYSTVLRQSEAARFVFFHSLEDGFDYKSIGGRTCRQISRIVGASGNRVAVEFGQCPFGRGFVVKVVGYFVGIGSKMPP